MFAKVYFKVYIRICSRPFGLPMLIETVADCSVIHSPILCFAALEYTACLGWAVLSKKQNKTQYYCTAVTLTEASPSDMPVQIFRTVVVV